MTVAPKIVRYLLSHTSYNTSVTQVSVTTCKSSEKAKGGLEQRNVLELA